MSRFDKLEPEHEPSPADTSRTPLSRFEARPDPAAERPHVEGWDPTKANGPVATDLERFASDGADGVRTATDELAELPNLECPACHAEAGKFETRCSRCHGALDSPEALELNRQRAASHRAERAANQVALEAQQAARLEAELREVTLQRENAEQLALDLERRYSGNLRGRAVRLIAGLVLLLGAVLIHHLVVSILLGCGATLLLVSCLPPEVRALFWRSHSSSHWW